MKHRYPWVLFALVVWLPFLAWAQTADHGASASVLEFRDWLIIILQVVSLFTVIFSAIKIINRNVREWEVREMRLMAIERELDQMRISIKDFSGMPVKLNDIASEIERLRNRLDRFLDVQGAKP
jgi:hypothetical protein